MANSDKNIVITPNTGQASQPSIVFTGADNNPVTFTVLDSGALSITGGPANKIQIDGTITATDINTSSAIDTSSITNSTTNQDLTLSTTGTGSVVIDNFSINGNTISSTNSNGDIILDPNGTGKITAGTGYTPSAALDLATKGYVDTELALSGGDVVNDTTPQLGGDLDVNGFSIISARSNENITLDPNGTGVVEIIGTNALGLPAGTTGDRPVAPSAGYIRYNTGITSVEFWNGSEWSTLSASTTFDSYPNSTTQQMPGNSGDYDLSYEATQTIQETPFDPTVTDAFGVNLGTVYSMMDPEGGFDNATDLGVL